MISIVIPAHNESSVIQRCLRTLTDGARPGELEIVVACNGCKDNTAELARSFDYPGIKVVETDKGSKILGLNMGDAAATGFPRFFVDADVTMNIDAIRKVAAALERGPALAAAPKMHLDLTGRGLLVNGFYRVWLSLPYHKSGGMIGSGVYAMSQAGRARFDKFPQIIADDAYAMYLFSPQERLMLDTCTFTITPPTEFWGLVKIKTRSRLGLYELKQKFPQMLGSNQKPTESVARALLRQPWLWPHVPAYVLVNVITRFRAKRQLAAKLTHQWERDDSSRRIVSQGATRP